MKKVYKPRKGHRMHQDMLRVAFLKKAKQIYGQSDNIQPSNHNMVDGVVSPPHSFDENILDDVEVNSSNRQGFPVEVDNNNSVHVNENDQASTGTCYTNPASQDFADWQVERRILSDEIANLKAAQYKQTASAVREKQNEMREHIEYAQIIVNRVGKNYTFDGEEEDPQRRVGKYTEFRNKIELAIDPQSRIRPEVEAKAIREALFSILKGYAFSQYQTMAKQDLTIEQILKTMDRTYGYRTDVPILVKRAFETCIYDDRCRDNTILAKAHVRWLKVIEAAKGWSAEKFILEVMKGELIGPETTRRISELADCDIDQFF